MRIASLFILLILHNAFAFSQADTLHAKKQGRGYIAFMGGMSGPLGSFSEKNLANAKSGLAKSGCTMEFTFSQKFYKTLGISIMLRGQFNGVDNAQIANQLYNEYPALNNPGLKTSGWKIQTLMFGGFHSYAPFKSKKISIDSRIMIGVALITTPSFEYREQNGICRKSVERNYMQLSYFTTSLLLGSGIRYEVSKYVSIKLDADYLIINPVQADVFTKPPACLDATTSNTTLFVQSVNLSAGIAFKFD